MMISMGRPSISPAPCPNRISAAGLQKAIVPAPSTTNRAYSAALANPNTAALADCVRWFSSLSITRPAKSASLSRSASSKSACGSVSSTQSEPIRWPSPVIRGAPAWKRTSGRSRKRPPSRCPSVPSPSLTTTTSERAMIRSQGRPCRGIRCRSTPIRATSQENSSSMRETQAIGILRLDAVNLTMRSRPASEPAPIMPQERRAASLAASCVGQCLSSIAAGADGLGNMASAPIMNGFHHRTLSNANGPSNALGGIAVGGLAKEQS